MYKVGDYIVCGSNGVCRVEQVGSLNMDGISKERIYYTLAPCYNASSTVFIPVDNEKVIVRPALTKKEAKALIEEIKEIESLWISNEKAREARYKEALYTCDCRELVKIIKTIYDRKCSREAEGKKVTFVDEKYFKIAEESLYGELSIALDLERDKVKDYVIAHI